MCTCHETEMALRTRAAKSVQSPQKAEVEAVRNQSSGHQQLFCLESEAGSGEVTEVVVDQADDVGRMSEEVSAHAALIHPGKRPSSCASKKSSPSAKSDTDQVEGIRSRLESLPRAFSFALGCGTRLGWT